jgi:hypothetical protein
MLFANDIPAVLGVCIPIFALSIPIVAIVTGNRTKAKVAEYRAILVQNMLDKDFTPDEIERVLKANDGVPDKLVSKCDRRRHDSEHAR